MEQIKCLKIVRACFCPRFIGGLAIIVIVAVSLSTNIYFVVISLTHPFRYHAHNGIIITIPLNDDTALNQTTPESITLFPTVFSSLAHAFQGSLQGSKTVRKSARCIQG
jgi:hypothetical protein